SSGQRDRIGFYRGLSRLVPRRVEVRTGEDVHGRGRGLQVLGLQAQVAGRAVSAAHADEYGNRPLARDGVQSPSAGSRLERYLRSRDAIFRYGIHGFAASSGEIPSIASGDEVLPRRPYDVCP